MSPQQVQFLNLLNLPARFNVQQTAWYLGVPEDDIRLLTRTKLLHPTGEPTLGAIKLYAYARLRRLRDDEKWVSKASSTIYRSLQSKNKKASAKRKRKR